MSWRPLISVVTLAILGVCNHGEWNRSLQAANGVARGTEQRWESLQIYPPQIELSGAQDYQSVIAVAERSDGVTVDVTERVQWRLPEDQRALIEQFRIKPLKNGKSTISAHWNGLEASAKILVSEVDQPRPVSFHLDVMPVLTRAGCNTGSCHGAARGKDGFRLSLFGYDPLGDHQRITREIGFRRINLALPEQSLIYLKAIGGVPHSGGKRMEPESEYAQTLRRWLQAGAPLDADTPPTCTSVDLYPKQAVLEGEQAVQRLVAVARYSDGTTRDVSSLAAFSTNNERSAAVSDRGSVTAGVRGEAFVMARFDTHTVGAQILTLPMGLNYEAPAVTGNYIDQLVGDKLKRLRMIPSPAV